MPEDTDIKLAQAKAEKLEAEIASLKVTNDKLQTELAKQKEEWRIAQFVAAKVIALQPIEKLIQVGRLEPKFREQVEAALEAQKASYAVGVTLSLPIALSVELSTSAKLPTESGLHGGTPISGRADVVLAAEVKKVMAERKITFDEASQAVLAVKPELAKQYNDAIPEIQGTRA